MIKVLWIFIILPLLMFLVLSGVVLIMVLVMTVTLFFVSMDTSVFFILYKEAAQADLTGIYLLYAVAVVISAVIVLVGEK